MDTGGNKGSYNSLLKKQRKIQPRIVQFCFSVPQNDHGIFMYSFWGQDIGIRPCRANRKHGFREGPHLIK